jgi:catechol 2,3-dioxygenase-like lactoylglutathione lyase family enzyme
MEQRLSFLTLGVADFTRARAFYEHGLGWKPVRVMDDVAFFQLPGFVFALYPRKLLAEDAHVEDTGGGFAGVTLAINQRDEAGVDTALADAAKAGGKITKPAQKAFWGGYHGYFVDPDGYAWEVAYNPAITIAPDGATIWKT